MTLKRSLFTILFVIAIVFNATSCSTQTTNILTTTRNDVTKGSDVTPGDSSVPSQTPYINENISIQMPILYYHAVSDTTFGIEQMFVRVQEFDDQMKYMKDHGYQCITFEDLPNIRNYEKPFMVTFDDGYEDNYLNAYPILQKYDFKAVVFLVTDYIDHSSFLKTTEIKTMLDRISFQSHTVSHEYLTNLTYDQIDIELKKSQSIIEGITGKKVDTIAYPFGDYNDSVLELTAKYYKYGVLMGGGIYYHNGEDLLRMNRVYIPRGLDMETFKESIGAK
jgi:peptidoglycan/xylan/chitin deacetylase (PgdA/CDA1 family)